MRIGRSLLREECMKQLPKRSEERIGCFRHSPAGWISLLLWMMIVAPKAASGQSKDIMDFTPEALKSVQVYSASMYMQSDREAPSSVTVITSDQIRQFGYRTLADALRSVRGFDVTYDRNYVYVGCGGSLVRGDIKSRCCCSSTGTA